jgi:DNA-binding CsgD family transcriptional regulator
MARTGRPPAEVILTAQERAQLERWSRRAKSSQALAQRCKIVLGCADGMSNKDIAIELRVHPTTVTK